MYQATRLSLFAATLVLAAGYAVGQEKEPENDKPKESPANATKTAETNADIRELTIHGAPETKPALRDHLLPSFLEQTPQNAAPLYLRAFVMLGDIRNNAEDDELVAKWLNETPLDKLPIADARALLGRYQSALAETATAARREHCDWGLPVRESGTELFSMLLPDVQQARRIARLLALQARVEIATGEFEQAVTTLRTLFSVSRHVARQPFLISGLVGLAIASQGLDVVEDFARASEAPNLYWPLTNLPAPLVDLQPGLHLEHDTVFLVFPELRDVQSSKFADEEWDRRAAELLARGQAMAAEFAPEAQDEVSQELAKLKSIEKAYESAKHRSIARGRQEADLAKMPKSRVVLLDMAESFAEVRDEMFKAFGLPYPQAEKVLKEADAAIAKAKTMGYGGQLAGLLLPAVQAVKAASTRGQAKIDALRCIEALRMHAARHGQLPASLDEVTVVPIPINPLTGKPFPYRLEGGVAELDLQDSQRPIVYRLRLAK
ncbi:MAG: hypothetical protein RIC55_16790 [Pirellulaceae bacterium]